METDGPLASFFKRIERRSQRAVAIVATARKLAVILWDMLVKKMAYSPVPSAEYQSKIRLSQVKHIQRKIRQLNINENELTLSTGYSFPCNFEIRPFALRPFWLYLQP